MITKCRASDVFKDYFDDPTFSDLTIRLSDRSIHVHRIVLCRKSKYFNSMLTGSFQVHPHCPQTNVRMSNSE